MLTERNQLWKEVFFVYYEVFYTELLSEALARKWLALDTFAGITIALTASGSAVAGWALWSQPGFKPIWATLAGTGALLSIVHRTIHVTQRLKDYSDSARRLAQLRVEFEALRHRIRMAKPTELSDVNKRFEELRKSSVDNSLVTNDIFLTSTLEEQTQQKLNRMLANEIKQPAPIRDT